MRRPVLALFVLSLLSIGSLLVGCGPEDAFLPPELMSAARPVPAASARLTTASASRASSTVSPQGDLARTTAAQVQPGAQPQWQDSFSIAATPEVWTAFDLVGLKRGRHVLAVFVYTESFGYQRVDLTFTVGTPPGPGEFAAESLGNRAYRVWSRLLVANTAISDYGLAGRWRVEGHLDGSATPIASAHFTLY